MSLESYLDQLEPQNRDAVIWRFMNMKKFENLISTAELYFCRADLFADQSEGLPPEGYYPFPHLNPLDVLDRRQIDDSRGNVAQFREAFYINCWHLFREETCKMWDKYGADGVAICSRYSLLNSALDAVTDRAFLGLVRYGTQGMKGWNLFRFVFTMRAEFADENEVRALLWIIDPHAANNRHIDAENRVYPSPLKPPHRVLDGHRRKVDMRALVTQIVVSPWASSTMFEEITQLVRNNGYEIPVASSELTRYRQFLPSL
jgi:hypothetical protein